MTSAFKSNLIQRPVIPHGEGPKVPSTKLKHPAVLHHKMQKLIICCDIIISFFGCLPLALVTTVNRFSLVICSPVRLFLLLEKNANRSDYWLTSWGDWAFKH